MSLLRRRRSASETAGDGVAAALRNRRRPEPSVECLLPENLIPSGSTMLNLACTDSYTGAYGKGRIVNTIGDSATGKSTLTLHTFAECAHDERFDDYHFEYDEAEAALAHDIENLFGKKTARRIGDPKRSIDVEDFVANLSRIIDRGEPFIYILDSFDGLGSKAEKKRLRANIKPKKGEEKKKAKGSYKTEKVIALTELLRNSVQAIEELESLLIIVSQTRDNLGFGAQFQPKRRNGGRALKFFSSHEMWLSHMGMIKKLEQQIGAYTQARVTKNKLTGKKRWINFPIYDQIGVDDIGSCIDFLVENKFWPKTKQTINCRGLGIKGTREKVIQKIERNDLIEDLRKFTGRKWKVMEKKLTLDRPSRYCD